jgi:hypothetical protein
MISPTSAEYTAPFRLPADLTQAEAGIFSRKALDPQIGYLLVGK